MTYRQMLRSFALVLCAVSAVAAAGCQLLCPAQSPSPNLESCDLKHTTKACWAYSTSATPGMCTFTKPTAGTPASCGNTACSVPSDCTSANGVVNTCVSGACITTN